MARRGRFGNPSGGSNLAITIQNMLRQKKAQEEQLLLQRFRNGQATLAEVQSFYNDWTSSAGYSPDSVDYKQIQQSIEDAKNQNLIFRYNDFSAEFDSTNGANYKDVMDFLNNEATTSTDSQNRQSFEAQKQKITTGYIQGAKSRLLSGEMTVDQFKADLAANFDSAFPPGDESAKTARYDALTAEYDAMISLFNNRITANLPGAYSGLQSFIKTFQKDLISYGINPKSGLYGRSQADAVTAGSGAKTAAATPSISRANSSSDKIGAILAELQKTGQTGLVALTDQDIKAGKTYGAGDLMNDPGIVAKIVRLVDTGVIPMPQGLINMGITDTSQLSNTIDHLVRSYSSNVISAATIDSRYSTAAIGARILASQVGVTTGVDEFRDALGRYTDDIHAAQVRGDDVAMGLAMHAWGEYLNRRGSKYGTLPSDSALNPPNSGSSGAGILDSIAASRAAMAGQPTNGVPAETYFGIAAQVTSNGAMTFQDAYANGSFAAVMRSYDDLLSGRAVQHVSYDKSHPELGPKYTTESRSPLTAQGVIFGSGVSAKGGLMTIMTLKDLGGGNFAPVMQQVENIGVVNIAQGGDTAAKTWGYIYRMESGATVYASVTSDFYDGNPFGQGTAPDPTSGNMLVTSGPLPTAVASKTAPAFDVQSVLKIAGNGDPSRATFDGIRSVVASAKKQIIDSGLSAMIPVGNTVDTMFDQVNKTADAMEMTNINQKVFDLKKKERSGYGAVDSTEYSALAARANEINSNEGSLPPEQRTSAGSLWNQQVLPNKDKYYEIQPGLWKLKPEVIAAKSLVQKNQAEAGQAIIHGVKPPFSMYNGINIYDSYGRPLSDTVDIRTPQVQIKAAQDAAAFKPSGALGISGTFELPAVKSPTLVTSQTNQSLNNQAMEGLHSASTAAAIVAPANTSKINIGGR